MEGVVCNVCPGRQVMDIAHFTNSKDKNGSNRRTHDQLVQEMAALSKCAGKTVSTTFPPPFLNLMSNETEAGRAIKGDIMMYSAGKPQVMLNAMIISPINPEVKRGEKVEPLAAARAGEKLKENTYTAKYDLIQIRFCPLVVEIYGA
jgi:hypothetical protein